MNCNCIENRESDLRLIYEYKNVVNLLPEVRDLQVVQCTHCGLVFSPGFPSDPIQLSRINHALGVTFDTGALRAREKVAAVSRILKMSDITDYEVIDVGGGSGEFSKIANELGILAHNFEPFSKNQEDSNLSVIEARVKSPKLVLTMFHVVEHIYDPISWLAELTESLQGNFDVLLLIEVPVVELETGFCDDPTPFYAPFHIRHFSIQTARAILGLAGLQILKEKANNDYNGYFFLVKPTLSKPNNVISIDRELQLHDSYALSYKNSMENLKTRLEKSLKDKALVVFWGAGIGYDFFTHNFADLFTHLPQVVVDKSPTRQIEGVKSLGELRVILENSHDILVIPTSFAKSEEIIDEALEMLYEIESKSFEVFEYVHVRAY